jgi:hypothetical protein
MQRESVFRLPFGRMPDVRLRERAYLRVARDVLVVVGGVHYDGDDAWQS